MSIKNTLQFQLTPVRELERVWGKKVNLYSCCAEYKLVQLIWMSVSQRHIQTGLPYDPAISLDRQNYHMTQLYNYTDRATIWPSCTIIKTELPYDPAISLYRQNYPAIYIIMEYVTKGLRSYQRYSCLFLLYSQSHETYLHVYQQMTG